MMKTIQMTIEDTLLVNVDNAVRTLETTRAAFIRDALEEALRRLSIADMERRHAQGYTQIPQVEAFSEWESEHVWGDA